MLVIGLAMLLSASPLAGAGVDEAAAKAWKKGLCKSCHGEDGSGNTPMGKKLGARDLRSDEAQRLTDEQIAETVRNGKSDMPSFEGVFSDEELANLIRYIRYLASAEQNDGDEPAKKQ